jgi:hypothetical protein
MFARGAVGASTDLVDVSAGMDLSMDKQFENAQHCPQVAASRLTNAALVARR